MTVLIEASHLRKTFGETVAVEDLSLQLAEGEIYGLVGSDGAGKTTTLRLLVGALRPDSGHANVCGFPLDKKAEQARAQLGYLSQRFSLYEDLTVLENIRFFAELRGQPPMQLRPALEKLEGVEDVRIFGDKLHLRVAAGKTDAVLSMLSLAFPAGAGSGVDVRLVPPTLEDVFIDLTVSGT